MDCRQPALNATVSTTASRGDALCKVAFVSINVAKATPSTSCRSMASSDSAESATSSTPTMTSSSRDSDDDEEGEDPPPSSTSTWTTYIYFYPRHDMTYTHCLLSTSRHIDCDTPCSTSACWPCIPGYDACRAAAPREETVSPGVASRWQRRVNAARTPFWFPVARSYDAAAPAYFYYPRHDLSYAEVEASRVDRQPGVDQSSLPFNTILEELADDATSLDDRSYVLEDRKSLVDDYSDVVPPCSVVADELLSATSSMSACQSDDDEMSITLSVSCYANKRVASNEAAEVSVSASDHDITSSNRRSNPRDAILTPVTKLDLKSLGESLSPRQRADGGRARPAGTRSPLATDRITRRCVSDPAVRPGDQQSPGRPLPLSARPINVRNKFAAASVAEEDRADDVLADGDQACVSPNAVIPLRAKHAVTCLLHHQRSASHNAVALSPHKASSPAPAGNEDVTISQCTSASFSMMSPSPAADKEVQRRVADSDQVENVDKTKDGSRECELDVPAASTDNVAWNVPVETTSPEMTSSDATSLVADSLSVGWSCSSSEYLTPPTRCGTSSVTASATVTTFCDATSQTPLDTEELYSAEVQPENVRRREDGETVIASSTFTRLCGAGSPRLCSNVGAVEVQTASPEQSKLLVGRDLTMQVRQNTSSAVDVDGRLSHIQSAYHEVNELELNLSQLNQNDDDDDVNYSTAAVTKIYDATSSMPEKTIRPTQPVRRSVHCENATTGDAICGKTFATLDTTGPSDFQPVHPCHLDDIDVVSTSSTITLIRDATSPTSHAVVPSTIVHLTHSRIRERNRSVTACGRQLSDDASPASVDANVSSTVFHAARPSALEQVEPGKKRGRESWPVAVVEVGRLHSEAVVGSCRQSLELRRLSTSALCESSRTAPAQRRPAARRPNIERIGPDSLADVGGLLTAYVAALTTRDRGTSRRAVAVDRRAPPSRAPCKSYVNIWRKRVATYEAFVNRCQTSVTSTGVPGVPGARCQYGASLHRH